MLKLNDAQERAVGTTEGPLLIVAGAGTGKTRVITERIVKIIKDGTSPHNILAITFTNKAAKEMKERVNHALENDKTLNRPISMGERPFISTFHSLGVHIIRENSTLLNVHKNFTIFDRSDSKKVIKDALASLSLDPKQYDPGIILNMISKAKGDSINFLTYKDHAKGYMDEIVAEVWEKYENQLNKEKALDFDDLLLKTANLLEKNIELKKKYSQIWKYIHVDEYQDTNRVQYKIVRLLTEFHQNLCVVGDADQNIYSWRGATIENILNFEKDYPAATVITLEKNYRSTKTILEAANSVIKKNIQRKKKNLYTDNENGEKISLSISYTETDEARGIADEARNLVEKGIDPKEIAVLYRTNFQSRVLEEAFIKKNIAYQM
jgi:DNA helicase-2/ATP-dependent DNA helicase PcrA